MKKDIIAIWTEGGEVVGMGHMARSINIAHAISKRGFGVRFYINDERHAEGRLRGEEYEFELLSLVDEGCELPYEEVVVIDTKRDVSPLVERLKKDGKRVVLIDNVTPAATVADTLIIPSAVPKQIDIKGDYFGGSEFIIVAESFRSVMESVERAGYSLPLKVLITMGGADPNGLTSLVLDAIHNLSNIEIVAVIGPAFNSDAALDIEQNYTNVRVVSGITDLAPLMVGCHIAFTALGTTVYELAYMGLPQIVISNYESDDRDLYELESLGFAIPLGFYKDVGAEDIRGVLDKFIESESEWEELSVRGKALTDGRGAERIADIILEAAGM